MEAISKIQQWTEEISEEHKHLKCLIGTDRERQDGHLKKCAWDSCVLMAKRFLEEAEKMRWRPYDCGLDQCKDNPWYVKIDDLRALFKPEEK